jgi:DNA-binding LytR/AlgR family response regulator
MTTGKKTVYGASTTLAPVQLVVCFRSLAALDALDALLLQLVDRADVPPTSTLLRTTDPRDILQFLDRPVYNVETAAPTMRYDCVFLLDATLDAPGSGIVLADHIREHSVDVPIFFLTDHLEYVLIAFRAQPFDFLPRPVGVERFAECLRSLSELQGVRREESRLRRAVPGTSAASSAGTATATATGTTSTPSTPRSAHSSRRRRRGDTDTSSQTHSTQWVDTTTPIALRCRGVVHQIAAGEILFIERNKTITTIHLASRRVDCSLPLSWFSDRLDPTGLFVRCHKSFLVNRRHILLIDLKARLVSLSYGHRCDIGRTYRKSMTDFSDPHVIRSPHPGATQQPAKGDV